MKTVQIALTSIAVSAIALLQAIISVGIQINIQDNDLQLTFPESYNIRGYRDRRRLNYDNNLHLDFALIGFPKTGTTFLLKQLEDHSQIRMSEGEFCQVHNVTSGAERVLTWLTDITSSSSTNKTSTGDKTKYGIKCPTMVRTMSAIENLMKISDITRLVVGVRHPVKWFESFYNYRVLEMYNNNVTEHVFGRMSGRSIPKPRELLDGTKHWKDVSTASARFDAYLKQLAKVPLNEDERKAMFDERLWPKKISPNPYKVFIYTVEQLHDKNETRQVNFQTDLQHHLGLNSPFRDFNKASKANAVHNSVRYKEQIDICDPQYARIRKKLAQQGKISSDWIINRFIESDDVVVSDKDYFTSTLRTWGNDPCLSELVSQS